MFWLGGGGGRKALERATVDAQLFYWIDIITGLIQYVLYGTMQRLDGQTKHRQCTSIYLK